MKIRLDRWAAGLGLCSRSEAKEWVRRGRISVGGRVIRDPAFSVETETDGLEVDGKPVDGRMCRHVMLHKPAGVLTAARDRKQPTVMDLLPPVYGSIGCMPVGRLDRDTTGLLIFTTDGELNHRLLSPGRHVMKRYRAIVRGRLEQDAVRRFAEGLDLGDFRAQGAELRILSAAEESSVAEVCLAEGKFHQVKRMFEAVGHEVLRLHRPAFGPLELDSALAEGSWRELTPEEAESLYTAAGLREAGREQGSAPV